MHMKIISFLLVLAVSLSCPILANAADDFDGAPDLAGFRGMKWGSNRTDFSGLALLNYDPIIQRYIKRSDNLRIGGVELESVIYNFYKGRFMGVSIETRGGR